MFHIVLCADENYIKYSAVLITSIVHNTDSTKSFNDIAREYTIKSNDCPPPPLYVDKEQEKYYFHIITDYITKESNDKLALLESSLNNVYPCSISVHIIKEDIFNNMDAFGEQGNKAAYYRLLLARFLSTDIKTCLYLDVDMLVVGDIRECFLYDLKDKVLGAVLDCSSWHDGRVIVSKGNDRAPFVISANTYFNSGFLLINLDKWRSNDMEKKALDISQHYYTACADQESLNILLKDSYKTLPLRCNIFVSGIYGYIGESNHTKEEYDKAESEAIVYHFCGPKPWNNAVLYIRKDEFIPTYMNKHRDLWWNVAYKTPIFSIELKQREIELQKKALDDYAISLSNSLRLSIKGIYDKINDVEKRTNRILYPHKAFRGFLKRLYIKMFRH